MIKFSRRYSSALGKHLALKPRASLRPAEGLGHEALAVGLDTLDRIGIHERALITLLSTGPRSRASSGTTRRAASFLVATLTPIENAHRAALKSDGKLSRVSATMRRRTVELAATPRLLKCAIGRRKAAQEALATSKQRYRELMEQCRTSREHLRRLSHEFHTARDGERRRVRR